MPEAQKMTGAPGADPNRHKNNQSHQAMGHLQVDLKSRDWIIADRFHPVFVVTLDGGGARIGPPLAVSRREIWDGKSGMLMPHRRADGKLGEDQTGWEQEEKPEMMAVRLRMNWQAAPEIHLKKRDGGDE